MPTETCPKCEGRGWFCGASLPASEWRCGEDHEKRCRLGRTCPDCSDGWTPMTSKPTRELETRFVPDPDNPGQGSLQVRVSPLARVADNAFQRGMAQGDLLNEGRALISRVLAEAGRLRAHAIGRGRRVGLDPVVLAMDHVLVRDLCAWSTDERHHVSRTDKALTAIMRDVKQEVDDA